MPDRLRTPFFIIAAVCLGLAVLFELAGMPLAVAMDDRIKEPPGLAIGYLAILDLLLAYTIATMGLGLMGPRRFVGRLQGPVTLVLSFIGLLGCLLLLIAAFMLLVIMVTLLVAVPFGTMAYVAGWGSFATGKAAMILMIVMTLKLAFLVLLVLSHQGFLKNKGLLILSLLSVGLTWVVGFLHAFPPGLLVSIADAIGAVVISVIGLIWLVLLFIGSLLATITTLRTARAS